MQIDLLDENETLKLGALIGENSRVGDFFALNGDLGAGKTTFARGFISRVAHTDDVPSPTFTILQTYDADNDSEICHFDLYRLEDPDEIWELGWEELGDKITLCEWCERAGQYLPQQRLEINIAFAKKDDETAQQPEIGNTEFGRIVKINILGDGEFSDYWQSRLKKIEQDKNENELK